MPNFAVLNTDNIIVNKIVAETKEKAETVTGLVCIEYSNEAVEVGGTYDGSTLWLPQPFDSWIKDEEKKEWKAPVEYPLDSKTYKWDEPSTSWIEIVF